MWECGLKHLIVDGTTGINESLLMWECGLKQMPKLRQRDTTFVTPYVGVWIETILR